MKEMGTDRARQVLDSFAVAERLQHIRRFVWRRGSLRVYFNERCVYYEVRADEQAIRVGIDLASPTVLFIRGRGMHSAVPCFGRSPEDVERALHTELQAIAAQTSPQSAGA
jgi:hypothetical protein